jgi:hypothetical protein
VASGESTRRAKAASRDLHDGSAHAAAHDASSDRATDAAQAKNKPDDGIEFF